MKVVINASFGGFSLSETGIRRYAEIKGVDLYPEAGRFGYITYWTVPAEKRPAPLEGDWLSHPLEVRAAHNKATSAAQIYDRDIPRDDAALVQAVEELGKVADGEFARLQVVEIPDDVSWVIEEYDGSEHVAEAHRTWA